jgi:hypothetical protein
MPSDDFGELVGELEAGSEVTVDVPEFTTEQRLDALGASLVDLHVKVDTLLAKVDTSLDGLSAVYARVDYLTKMLSAVQQVAGMMPGMGKKLNQAMAAMDQNGAQAHG